MILKYIILCYIELVYALSVIVLWIRPVIERWHNIFNFVSHWLGAYTKMIHALFDAVFIDQFKVDMISIWNLCHKLHVARLMVLVFMIGSCQ